MPGKPCAQALAQTMLVVGVEKAKEKGDGHGLHARFLQLGNQGVDLILGKRCDDGAVGADALGDLETVAARDQHGRRVLEKVVEIGAGGSAQFQDVAEAARGDKGGARALLLENGVGDNGSGVREQADIVRRHPVLLHRHLECGEYALGQIARGARHLGDADSTGCFVDQGNVGKGATDVDADAPGHGSGHRRNGCVDRLA